jgi:hypothetical protein
MDVVAHHIFFDLYDLFFCLDNFYGVFSGFISLTYDLEIGERKYIEICYISLKYVVYHI